MREIYWVFSGEGERDENDGRKEEIERIILEVIVYLK